MSKKLDLTGQTFGRLTVLSKAGTDKDSKTIWECLCECGQTKLVITNRLRRGITQSCGCLYNDVHTKHSRSHSPLYRVWSQMKGRCTNPKHPKYASYGGRGITVCDRWLDFNNFQQDMGERPSPQHSLDRKDNDKGYCPENCRWATSAEQANNKRTNRFLTYQNKTLTLKQWSDHSGLSKAKIRQRLERGWDIERTLTTP
ncbi:MAG: hypothetical protein KME18_07570 [Phormidium tanganyikae FI6-MK23]|jgi:hypothetical protein|nr:hypothetical protein [Phormidium tanganyikae FI6-MK23]